jgi:hypothetical protein
MVSSKIQKNIVLFLSNQETMNTFSNSYNLDVLAIFGLMIGLYLFSVKHEKRMYYFLFLLSTVASGLLLSQTNYDIFQFPVIYPFAIPFLYTIGPSYFFFKNRYRFKTYEIWIHYLPALFIVAACALHILVYPTNFQISRDYFLTFHPLDAASTYVITDGLLILAYPFHATLYFTGNMLLNKREEVEFNFDDNLSGMAMLIISPFVFALTHIFVHGENSWLLPFKDALIFILIGTIPAIAFDLLLQYRSSKKVEAIADGLKTIDLAHVSVFLNKQVSLESEFTKPGFNREDMYKASGISEVDWKEYMIRKDFNFPSLKKWVRVQIAKKLMYEGYLEKYNVDALSEAVGYRSRTSFYSAYREIERESLSEFRSRL